MKNSLLTLIAFVLVSVVTAQPALMILDSYDNDITGKSITVYSANPLADLLESHLKVKNSGDVDLSVWVRRIVNSSVTESSNAFCFGVNCYPPFIDTSQVETPLAVGEINTSFIGDYYPGGGRGISSITYEFYDVTSTASKVAASVTVLYAVADVLDITDEEGHLVNNSTIVVHSEDTSMAAYLDAKVKVKNNTSAELLMYARRIQNAVVPGSSNTFCYGVCYPPFVDTSSVVVVIPAGATDENFIADYTPNGNAGATSLTYEFYDLYTLGDKVSASVTIIFNLSGVGFPESQTSVHTSIFPNPASAFATFSYELSVKAREAYLTIRNMQGMEAGTIMLDHPSGKAIIPTGHLPAGIYLCTLTIDGNRISTKKLSVQH